MPYLWRKYFILLSFISKNTFLLFFYLVFFVGCNEKPNVLIKSDLVVPISCMKIDVLGVEKEFIETLNKLFTFNENCNLVLYISYKKDIICNSRHNVENMSKKPKSYLQMQLREGLDVKYSYYIDLYSNVDIENAFNRLEEEIIKVEKKK